MNVIAFVAALLAMRTLVRDEQTSVERARAAGEEIEATDAA